MYEDACEPMIVVRYIDWLSLPWRNRFFFEQSARMFILARSLEAYEYQSSNTVAYQSHHHCQPQAASRKVVIHFCL